VARAGVKGTPYLDITVAGLGRIHRHIGSRVPGVIRDVRAAFRVIKAQGRHDVLERVRDGSLTPLQALDYVRRGARAPLASRETAGPLLPKLREFGKVYAQSASYARDVRLLTTQLQRIARSRPRVADAPRLLRKLKERYEKAGAAVTFNRYRHILMSFVQWATAEKEPPLWDEVRRVTTIPKRRTAPKEGLSVEAFRAVVAHLPPAHAAIAWTAVLTGMNPKELWHDGWEEDRVAGIVRIHGEKRFGRERIVPWVAPLARPTRDYRRYRIQLHRAGGPTLTPNRLRHTYLQWLEEAGVPRTHRKAYAGHRSLKDTTETYEDRLITPETCRADGRLLRAYIGRGAGVLHLEARSA